MAAAPIVLVEQALPLAVIARPVWRGLARAVAESSIWDWGSLLLVGAGASTLATLLFTQAFTFGSPTTRYSLNSCSRSSRSAAPGC